MAKWALDALPIKSWLVICDRQSTAGCSLCVELGNSTEHTVWVLYVQYEACEQPDFD